MSAASWQEGDIAYLKCHECFSDGDYRELIASGAISEGATGHPCIILKVLPGPRVVITTISAYGSGDHNNNCAPWIAMRCYSQEKWFFRSFQGSVCGNNYKPLQLIPGQKMPKPETSWLFIKNVYSVPLSVIGRFTKPRDGQLLKMTPRSLADLQSDIAKRSPNYNPCWQLVDTAAPSKKSSTNTTRRQPQSLSEAAMIASATCMRPAVNTTTPIAPPKQAQCSLGAGSTLRSAPRSAPASSRQTPAQPNPISWAAVASKPVAAKPTGNLIPRRTTSMMHRDRMVKATA